MRIKHNRPKQRNWLQGKDASVKLINLKNTFTANATASGANAIVVTVSTDLKVYVCVCVPHTPAYRDTDMYIFTTSTQILIMHDRGESLIK